MAPGTAPTSDDGHPGPCDYYMIRVARPVDGAGPALSGLVERLGTGEKHAFADLAELVRLITAGAPGAVHATSDRPLD